MEKELYQYHRHIYVCNPSAKELLYLSILLRATFIASTDSSAFLIVPEIAFFSLPPSPTKATGTGKTHTQTQCPRTSLPAHTQTNSSPKIQPSLHRKFSPAKPPGKLSPASRTYSFLEFSRPYRQPQ